MYKRGNLELSTLGGERVCQNHVARREPEGLHERINFTLTFLAFQMEKKWDGGGGRTSWTESTGIRGCEEGRKPRVVFPRGENQLIRYSCVRACAKQLLSILSIAGKVYLLNPPAKLTGSSLCVLACGHSRLPSGGSDCIPRERGVCACV